MKQVILRILDKTQRIMFFLFSYIFKKNSPLLIYKNVYLFQKGICDISVPESVAFKI